MCYVFHSNTLGNTTLHNHFECTVPANSTGYVAFPDRESLKMPQPSKEEIGTNDRKVAITATVPPEVEASLPPALCYSNEVVLFSSEGDHFLMPEAFKPQALTCVSNHDIPTLNAWWECLDLDLRQELGIYDAERTQQEKQARHQDKLALLKTLTDIGEQPWGVNPDDLSSLGYSRDMMEKIHYYLTKTASKIVVVQLEDILQVETPVNVPGTCDEYPNWRRKLTDNIENLFADKANKAFFENLSVIRKG